ncbi:MAG: hypothetical protein ACRENK_05970 [Gemmatimonadaceae bacterium]
MRFALVMLATMYLGRRLGWIASRRVFYRETGAVLWFLVLMWGVAVSWIIRVSIDAGHPGTLIRWVLGYALGLYITVPNYGLFLESTIPTEDIRRHQVITSVPLVAYVVTSALLAAPWLAPLSTILVILQWFLFGAAGYWIGSRRRRLWRGIGLAIAAAFAVNALLSLLDLALVGDPLPGGLPSPPGWDPTHAQAIGEYAGTTLTLIWGWIVGRRARIGRDASFRPDEQTA